MGIVRVIFLSGLLVLSGVFAAVAGESGSALKADDVKAEPFRDAKTLGSLKAGDKVEIVKRDGGWYLLSAPKKGWVKMLSIKKGGPAATVKASGVAALASGRSGKGSVVASTGVRGLNEEDLKNAHFDEKELELDESYGASRKDAEKFAAKAKLKARTVEYLKE